MTRLALAAFLTLTTLPARADVTAFCMAAPNTNAAQCTCATDKLTAQIGATETRLFGAVAGLFMENRRAGQGMLKAWRAAVDAVAGQNGITSDALKARLKLAGDAHRAAGKACN